MLAHLSILMPIALFLSHCTLVTLTLFLFIISNSGLLHWLFSGPERQIFTYLASSHYLVLIKGHLFKDAFLDHPNTFPWCSLQHSLPGDSVFVCSSNGFMVLFSRAVIFNAVPQYLEQKLAQVEWVNAEFVITFLKSPTRKSQEGALKIDPALVWAPVVLCVCICNYQMIS